MSNPEEEPLGGRTIVVPEMRDVHAEDTPRKQTDMDLEADNKRSGLPRRQESLAKRIKAARQESKNPAQTVQNTAALICATFVCTLFQGVFQLVIAICCIVTGAIYKDDCPAQDWIPVYLIVTGSVTLVSFAINCFWNYYQARLKGKENRGEDVEQPGGCCRCLILLRAIVTILMAVFGLAWFIAGSVWVYGIHGEFSGSKGDADYCNGTVYWFAFVLITIAWCTIGLLLLVAVCGCCLACIVQ